MNKTTRPFLIEEPNNYNDVEHCIEAYPKSGDDDFIPLCQYGIN